MEAAGETVGARVEVDMVARLIRNGSIWSGLVERAARLGRSARWLTVALAVAAGREAESMSGEAGAVVVAPDTVLGNVWSDLKGRPLGARKPHYDQVFQGF